MAFTLRIKMTGLCMFVPVPTAPDGPCLHALLLSHHHEHFPRLVYDKAYERANAAALTNRLRCIALDDHALRFAGIGTPIPANDPTAFCDPGGSCKPHRLPDAVTPMDEIGCTVQPVDRSLLRPNPPGLVVARVSIHDGALIDFVQGESWKTKGGVKASLTPGITWGIQATGKSLTIVLGDLRDVNEPEMKRITLYPLRAGTLDLVIYNAPAKDLPPVTRLPGDHPKKGGKAEHFEPYFDVVGAPGCKQDGIPELVNDPRGVDRVNTSSDCKPGVAEMRPAADKMDRLLKPFEIQTAHTSTCVTAQSPPK